MKLTKKLLLLQFSVMLIFIFSACNYESGVMKTLPKYSGCEKYSYGARDFVDYHKSVSYTHLTLPTTPYV